MAKLHKMVNGQKIDLTEEEEIAIRAEWEQNRIELNEKRMAKKALDEDRLRLKGEVCKKLGITIEELELITGN